jgi:hypothetical protein
VEVAEAVVDVASSVVVWPSVVVEVAASVVLSPSGTVEVEVAASVVL